MKIAMICRRYYPEIGGIETHVKELSERLVLKNHELIVFTLVNESRLAGIETINGVTVKRFKHLGLNYSAEIPPKSLLKEVEQFEPDIIHSHSAHTSIPYFASKIKSNSKFIITPHYQGNATTKFRRALFMAYKPFLNSAMSKTDRIICVSSAEREMLLDTFDVDPQKIRIVPNGVGADLVGITTDNTQRGKLRVLSVGRFDLSHKRTDKLIRAFKILSSRIDSTLVLVGSGPDTEEIKRMIANLDLNDRVEIKSNLSREELIREYSKASIFVTASEQEAFGIAVAEALAAKLRVIVPNSTALSTYVKEGYALGLELPVTPESIAEAITKCIQNNFNNVQYSAYTWDMASVDVEEVYEEIWRNNPR